MFNTKFIIIFLFVLYLLQLGVSTEKQENFININDLICGKNTITCIKNNVKLDGYCYYPEKNIMVSRNCMKSYNPECKKIKIGNDDYFISMKKKDDNCPNLKEITLAPKITPKPTEDPEVVLKRNMKKYKKLLQELEKIENYIVNEDGMNSPEQNIAEEKYKKRLIKQKKKEIKKFEKLLKDELYNFKLDSDKKLKSVVKINNNKKNKDKKGIVSLAYELDKQKQFNELKEIKKKIQKKLEENKKNEEEREKQRINACINLNKRDGLSDAQIIKNIGKNYSDTPFLNDNDLKNMKQIQKDIENKCKPCPKCPKEKTINDFDITDHKHFKYFTLKSEKCPECKTECIDGTKKCPVCPNSSPVNGVTIYDSRYKTNIGSIVKDELFN